VPSSEKRQRQKENARAAREVREAEERRRKRNRRIITVGAIVVAFALFVLIINIVTGDDDGNDVAADNTSTTPSSAAAPTGEPCTADPESTQTATITTNFGDITVALDNGRAPKGAERFAKLSNDGFYDGLTWHRVVPDFVIQGGDPKGDGTGGSGDSVVAEVPTDNYPLGSLAAAKTGTDPAGTFDSQFFIVTGSGGSSLPNDYARFGCVTSGLEVAQQIEHLAPDTGDGPPTDTATIDKVVISATPATTTTGAGADATTTTTPN
jgi:cyclophilin family peptidyl-prolyl cis-trans isomerase